jgi:prepilin-type N-terminal cleavage/methylation domain-containing protein
MNKTALRPAFTLTELLIVVAIIVIITGGLMPAFSTYLRGQKVKQAQETLKSDIRTVQNKALTGALSNMDLGGENPQYWGVTFTSGSSEYVPFVSVDTDSCNDSIQGKYNLSDEVVIDADTFSGGGNGCLFFNISDGSITSDGIGSSIVISLSGQCASIEFNSAGLIYSGDVDSCD